MAKQQPPARHASSGKSTSGHNNNQNPKAALQKSAPAPASSSRRTSPPAQAGFSGQISRVQAPPPPPEPEYQEPVEESPELEPGEESGYVEADEVDQRGDGNQNQHLGGDGADINESDPFAVYGGEELKVEARRKDAHITTVLSVSRMDSERSDAKGILVKLLSNDTGAEMDWRIWLPKPFVEDTGAFLSRNKGIEDLSPGHPDPERPGKMKGNERVQYGMAVRNSAGDASIQSLLGIAAKAGRRPSDQFVADVQGGNVDFDSYVEELNTVLMDLEVVAARTPETSDDNPRGFLKVSRVYFPADVINNPKALKNYLKQWEAAQ